MNNTGVAVERAKESAPPQVAETKPETAFDRMTLIFNDIARRAFEIFESDGRVFGHDVENWLKAERELLHPVSIELTEMDKAFEIKAEVPGFSQKELEINVEPRRVVISGRHEAKTEESKKGNLVSSETRSEQVLRMVELPAPVDTAKVTATLKNGILTVALPKVETAQAVRITPTNP